MFKVEIVNFKHTSNRRGDTESCQLKVTMGADSLELTSKNILKSTDVLSSYTKILDVVKQEIERLNSTN